MWAELTRVHLAYRHLNQKKGERATENPNLLFYFSPNLIAISAAKMYKPRYSIAYIFQ